MTRIESWSAVPVGSVVTLRRHSGERTKAWTASGPFRSSTGVPVIRVDIAGVVLSYPLDRVSLGWEEPRPAATVPLATVLDPAPTVAAPGDPFASWAMTACLLYFVAMGGAALAGWLFR